ncbi:branched-chain amino acid ABC transporter permease [Arthrobacter castelli]|uniref:branched-chain amino acid ABC transporter permease n=1 Tax=Arthrobacter castelli TaxID=271431 RepID=UPI000426E113|nr:branched-chain amino acid ABC transporter permease [Arthrobacter castelli]
MNRTIFKRRWFRISVIAVLALAAVLAPLELVPYANYQLTMIAVMGVAILGVNIITGYTGQISLGQSAFLGLGAYVTAYGVTEGWPVPLVFLLAAVIPGAVGLLIALPAVRLKGASIAMVTISLPIIADPLAKRLTDITGGSAGITVQWMSAPEWTGLADDQWRYYIVGAIALVFFVLAWNLTRGRIGRAFAIVRDNEAVATSMGISSYKYKVLAFTIASAYGGVAGFLYLAAVQYMSPATLSFIVGINLLAAMIIGGSASIIGSLFGGVFYVFIPVVAGQIDPSHTPIVYGAALLLILFLAPGGVVTLPRVLRRLMGRRTGRQQQPGGGDDQATESSAGKVTS